MLQNEASLAIVAVHTAENEPLKIWGYSFSYSVTSLLLSKRWRQREGGRNESCLLERLIQRYGNFLGPLHGSDDPSPRHLTVG